MVRNFLVVSLAAAALLPAQTPVEPIGAIVEAFRTHSIVAIGNVEFRGNEQCQAFHRALVRDPRFAAAFNDIVVEFGGARYQDVIDRFVRGEDIPAATLRQVWQNTTQVEYEWDLPIYEEFFRTVRTVNASLPRDRQLRVLLGDPAMDWDKIRAIDDLHRGMGDRDAHAVEVIRREVLAKNRKALVIYGGHHLLRKNTVAGATDEWANGIVARLERDKIAKVFTVLPETRRDLTAIVSNVGSWPVPSLAILRGTPLGATIWEQGPQRRPVRIEDQVDAILYLGSPGSMTSAKLSPALCADRSYIDMRLGRLKLIPAPPGALAGPAEMLKEYCANPGGPKEIADGQPAITETIRKTLRDAAQGKVDAEDIAPESRERVTAMLQRDGPRFLGPAGALTSLTLVGESKDTKHVRRYRSVFASGLSILWTVELSATGKILALSPRPE